VLRLLPFLNPDPLFREYQIKWRCVRAGSPHFPEEEIFMEETKSISIMNLIAIPALITLGITILRLVGELEHWPQPWFSTAGGGGGAIIGISWLPFIFGPYFALKLAGAGDRPSSLGKALGYAFFGLVVFVLGALLAQAAIRHPSNLILLAFLLMLAAAFIPGIGWRSLGNTLLAYALAARIPVLIVMFIAMRANGGQGLGTHYDAVPPTFAQASFAKRFLEMAIAPQLTLWIGWTVVVGSIFGGIAAAVSRRGNQVAPAAM
jgi:hypothetical protein